MKNSLQSIFPSTTKLITTADKSKQHKINYLSSLLESLAYIDDYSKFHPERNVLYHSLQVFQLAKIDSTDPVLWATALFHDIGKAEDYPHHAQVGAELLDGILCPRAIWLIKHHLDLLKSEKKTQSKLKNTRQLRELQKLRRWDIKGREPNVDVVSIGAAIIELSNHFSMITNPGDTYQNQ